MIGCIFFPCFAVHVEWTNNPSLNRVMEKLAAGWKYGRNKDIEKRTHPSICDWDKLPKKEQDKDWQTVRRFPDYLSQAGFEIYRLDSMPSPFILHLPLIAFEKVLPMAFPFPSFWKSPFRVWE